ncbi:hypothetical protein [Polymorphobacter fuscus]|uniref:Uncharacterized protein n=1 Tax=Sandarakinorhabdus fusca TaxID=1439888 RepID=A0A7C9GWJ6_9SPHN|nr:hypothetical protein [Polymorphobacter fuscus]KAB7645600.1 hypothetical protein F9290_12360 [Polymorphobacter fuscus]MQT18049.1 hypothetical protein [Polymorphobacter fuscus]NJC08682.1 hypothetical protein [Polymorphobacter fuscus]
MRLFPAVVVLLAPAIAAMPAAAATPAAMAQGFADAAAACRTASDLRDAAVVGAPILFSDTAGKTALLVTGRWRPAHMKGARATMLCLYDRTSRRAEAQEAPGWTARTRR